MLPQLAVSAKILCLLMVVICGAVPSMVRSVRLYSQCSQGYLRIYPNGTVMARGSDVREQYQNLTISTEDIQLKLLIFAPEARRYLCYDQRWKLVGRAIKKWQALREPRCQFIEAMWLQAYNTYQSVAESSRFMSFNRHGQQPGPRRAASPAMRRCRNFLKMDWNFSISDHNSRVAEAAGAELRGPQHKRAHAPKRPYAPKRPRSQEKLRHAHSRHLRRKKLPNYET